MKRRIFIAIIPVFLIAFFVIAKKELYTRKPMEFTFDAAYYFQEQEREFCGWKFEKVPAGHQYYFYLPESVRSNKDDESKKVPLIVVLHGSDEKGSALHKYGYQFLNEKFQQKVSPNGAAILVILSRVNYFTDPKGTDLLIQNVALKNKCIDKTKIVAYGFSQGAMFAVQLCTAEPRLFKSVISGSGFYQMSKKELLTVLPVQFYFATAQNDQGIFEQGSPTGKMCAKWCKNSRYVEYKERRHFFVELKDKTGRGDETALDWICQSVQD